MKTFTETERLEIQQRIERAIRAPFDGLRPEHFLHEKGPAEICVGTPTISNNTKCLSVGVAIGMPHKVRLINFCTFWLN